MSEHDETQGEMAEQADDEKVMTPREHDDALIDEARKLGVTPGQLRDANAAGLSARLVAEAGYEAEERHVGRLLPPEDQELRLKVGELETQSAARFRIMQAIDGEVSGLRRDVGERGERLVALEQQLEGPFTCPDHEDLLQKVEELEARLNVADLRPGAPAMLDRRVAELESWNACRPKVMDPLDSFMLDRLLGVSGPDAPVTRAEFEAFNERLKAVDWSIPDPDTPETLDPDLSEEAQMEARVKAVTKVIGEAIGVVKGVCEPSAVRAIVSHHLDHAMAAAKDAARVKSP